MADEALDPARLITVDEATRLRAWSDAISDPAEERNSFTLHAPLEVTARHALFAHASAASEAGYVAQQNAAVATYRRYCGAPTTTSPAASASWEELRQALRAGNRSAASGVLRLLLAATDHERVIATLLPMTQHSLAAAGHAPILFARLLRMDYRMADAASSMLAATVAEFAQSTPAPRFEWEPSAMRRAQDPSGFRTRDDNASDDRSSARAEGLTTRTLHWLASLYRPADLPTTRGIAPLIQSADQQRVFDDAPAAVVNTSWAIGPLHDALAKACCRAAAWSMVREPDQHARYGWSHALTLPLANWMLGRAGRMASGTALRNAIAFAAAFRFDHGAGPLACEPPVAPGEALAGLLGVDADAAAAAAWHGAPEPVWRLLVDAAVIRNDAHLVKHTLAALDAATLDRDAAALYQAAAAKLVSLWVTAQPDDAIADTLDQRDLA